MRVFNIGDRVQITRGPFASFTGVVEKVSVTKLSLIVAVEIFGRRVPVPIGSRSVERAAPENARSRRMMNPN
jgi:transcriptional antiterminator NusG